MRVLGIAGSLRRGSYNRALLEAARQLTPPDMQVEPFALDGIPLYNADLDADRRRPDEVERAAYLKELEVWTRRVAPPTPPRS